MARKTASAIMMSLLLLGTLALVFNVQLVWASGTIYIRADGSIDPPTAPIFSTDNITYTLTGNIIAGASADGIHIERDNITVDGAGYTIQGTGAQDGIYLNERSNVTIKNTTIDTCTAGIALSSSSNNTISGNNIAESGAGIHLGSSGIYLGSSSNYNSISGNSITNSWYGMHIDSSSTNSISGNNITANNGYGLYLYSSLSNIISGNNIRTNYNGGIWFQFSSSNSISGNNITESDGGIWFEFSSNYNNISENNITNNSISIELDFSSNYNTISGNNITNNFDGILLADSSSNSISGNNIIASRSGGILLSSSSNNSISGNNMPDNHNGLWLDSSSSNIISGNSITNSWYGIRLDSSSSNIIFHNNFINNGIQVNSIDSTNIWDNGYPSGGNYWSDYSGTDAYSSPSQNIPGSDGIGDTPYVIDTSDIDHYPLMSPCARWIEAGENVTVSFPSGVSLIFDNVTSEGIIAINETSFELSRPLGFILPTQPPVYYDIVTTLNYSGNVTVCVAYNDTGATQEEESSLKLMHWDETLQEWVNITTYIDTANNIIYGETSSLSPFGIMLQTIPGDINGDFNVNLGDLVLLSNAWGTSPSHPIKGTCVWSPNADIDCSGSIDLGDLVLMSNNWRQHYP